MATLTQISQALNDLLPKLKPLSMPTGMLGHFYSVPDGWLLCNGAAVSRSTYAALFAVIGTKHGSGDGSTTFNLPNLANRFVEGTTSIGSVGTFKSAGLPNISGGFDVVQNIKANAAEGPFFFPDGQGDDYKVGGNVSVHGWLGFVASRANVVFGTSDGVQPASMALLPCIKA